MKAKYFKLFQYLLVISLSSVSMLYGLGFQKNISINKHQISLNSSATKAEIAYIKTSILTNNKLKIEIRIKNTGKKNIESKKLYIYGYLLNRHHKKKIFSTHSANTINPNQYQTRTVYVNKIDCQKLESKSKIYIELKNNKGKTVNKKTSNNICPKKSFHLNSTSVFGTKKNRNITLKNNIKNMYPKDLFVEEIVTKAGIGQSLFGNREKMYIIKIKFNQPVKVASYRSGIKVFTRYNNLKRCLKKPDILNNNTTFITKCLSRKIKCRKTSHYKNGKVVTEQTCLLPPIKIVLSGYVVTPKHNGQQSYLNHKMGLAYTTGYIPYPNGKDKYRRH